MNETTEVWRSPTGSGAVVRNDSATRPPLPPGEYTVENSGRTVTAPIPPCHLLGIDPVDSGLRGASLVWQVAVTDCPWGDFTYHQVWGNGVWQGAYAGEADVAQVTATVRYSDAIRVATGEVGIYECVERGATVLGETEDLLLLAGLPTTAELLPIEPTLIDPLNEFAAALDAGALHDA